MLRYPHDLSDAAVAVNRTAVGLIRTERFDYISVREGTRTQSFAMPVSKVSLLNNNNAARMRGVSLGRRAGGTNCQGGAFGTLRAFVLGYIRQFGSSNEERRIY